jgi:hypothetical protein
MTTRACLLLLTFVCIPAIGCADEPNWSAEKLQHWAWKAPVRPALPVVRDAAWGRNEIDAFILGRLEEKGLRPAAPARAPTLVRRLYLDLIGLPPTPAQIDDFERAFAASPPAAVAALVDQLLASRHYGERWGRHWLDLARFAESNGYEFDEARPEAWRYRDYVINAFNADKPYDRFILEQLAGDEIAPGDQAAQVATGFNLLGPDMTDAANQEQRRQNTLDDMTDTASLAFLGLTLGCARCHNHKFEPISQADYFRVQAFFTPAQFRRADPKAKTKTPPGIMSLYETGEAPKTFVLRRGELRSRGAEVEPSWPTILCPDRRPEPAAVKAPVPTSTGRRTALARWIANPDNPLTARVLVNRLWQHHFGRPLVATPNDFGLNGQRPTHPELLDFLADEFVARGWSIKQMHRLMLTSATYQQASQGQGGADDNVLLAGMNRLRLEGEIVRDSLLAISGRLNPRMGGPGVFPPIALEASAGAKTVWKTSADPADHVRRSVYIFARRNLRFPFLEPFDLPDSNQSCAVRERSTSAPQSLALLNASEVADAARTLAARLEREAAGSDERVALAYRLALARRPTDAEASLAREFLAEAPLSEFCRALFNLNEFVYVD